MRVLLRNSWRYPEFWIGLFLFGLIYWGTTNLFMRAQRVDFQQRIDDAALQTVREIRSEITALREQERVLWEQNQRSMKDRDTIHKEVKKVKEEVIKLKGSDPKESLR